MSGDARPVLALRQGSHTFHEEAMEVKDNRVDMNYSFPCREGYGDLYVLLRLEAGEGSFHLKELYWSPYSKIFLEQVNMILPDCRFVRWDE